MVVHVATCTGIADSSMCLSAAFDVVLHILTESHAGECAVMTDACLSVDEVNHATCLDGVGGREDMTIDDFGIG